MLRTRHILSILLVTIFPMIVTFSYGQKKINLDTLEKQAGAAHLTLKEQSDLMDQLIEEAQKQGNNKILCRAYMGKIVAAYNTYDVKEVEKWIVLLEPLAIQEKEYNLYFRGKQCFIDLMLLKGKLEKGEEEAKKMLAEAKDQNHKVGITLAHLCLSHVYSMSYREKLAAQELEHGYQIALQTDRVWITKEIIHALISSYGVLKDYPNQLKYLKKQAELLRKRIKEHPAEAASVNPDLNLAYIMFVTHYLRTENSTMAKQYLDSSTRYFSPNEASIYKSFYYEGSLRYYEYVKDYTNALWSIDSLLKYATAEPDSYYTFHSIKARILWKSGAVKEAADLYEETLFLRDSLSSQLLNTQIEQIQQTDKNSQIQLEKEKIQNYLNLSLLIATLVVLAMLIGYIIHTIKVKKSLQKAEQAVRKMSEQMEGANLAKDKFLSNISQSISTPLNIIVNTSTELASGKTISAEKKDELSATVLETTETLMALINNILDLSRLEAGMMKFSTEELSPLSYIRLFLCTANDRKVEISCSTTEEELEKHLISFDSGKFSQLLDKIFTRHERLTLSLGVADNVLKLTIIGSALASLQLTQDIIIQNEINRLLVQYFKGEYLVQPEQAAIEITLPTTL